MSGSIPILHQHPLIDLSSLVLLLQGFWRLLYFWIFLYLGLYQSVCCYRCLYTSQGRMQDFLEGAPTPNGWMQTYYSTKFSSKLHENEENLAGESRPKFFCIDPLLLDIPLNTLKLSFRTYHHSFCHLHSKSIQPYSSMSEIRLHSYRSVRIHHCSFHTHFYLFLKIIIWVSI